MKHSLISLSLALSFCASPIWTQETTPSPTKTEQTATKDFPKEETVTTSHKVRIGGVDVSYRATVGTQLLNDSTKGTPKASLFYVAYLKEGVADPKKRPITFCFNGGPGSSSVWLHLGVLGPKRVNIDEEGKVALQPYHLEDNPYSLLDMTDLVFIDPVSTGYSRALPGEDLKQFHSVEGDIQSVAEFIRLFITRNERWESPKFLAGESYGTTRAAGLAQELHDTQYLYLDGIVLISCVLNFQTIVFAEGNDLPYLLTLPSLTATAYYHHKLPDDLQQDLDKTLAEVKQFACGEYAMALMYGDSLPSEERKKIVEKLARYTGLSSQYVDMSDLRISMLRFAKELLRSERRTVGRFDSRLKGIDSDLCGNVFEFDPSLENVLGLFAATFNDYVRRDLNWKHDEEYKVLTDVAPWDFGSATNKFLNVTDKLRDVMSKNTSLEVFVGSGLWDLATPFFCTDYTFDHLGLDPTLRDHVTIKMYEGGHMMYLYYPSLVKLKEDLAHFMQQRLSKMQVEK